MLDLAVNIGTDNATLCLQRALRACAKRTEEDGVLGSVTRAAASGANQVASTIGVEIGSSRLLPPPGDATREPRKRGKVSRGVVESRL